MIEVERNPTSTASASHLRPRGQNSACPRCALFLGMHENDDLGGCSPPHADPKPICTAADQKRGKGVFVSLSRRSCCVIYQITSFHLVLFHEIPMGVPVRSNWWFRPLLARMLPIPFAASSHLKLGLGTCRRHAVAGDGVPSGAWRRGCSHMQTIDAGCCGRRNSTRGCP